jgi:hypothetical protein
VFRFLSSLTLCVVTLPHRAISQALYPSEGDHSLIVWIDIQWWNATEQPGVIPPSPIRISLQSSNSARCSFIVTQVWDEWAWSTSCLYVVLPLDLFPLLSIWVFNPQQRMQEVHPPTSFFGRSHSCIHKVTVSLPPFCENVTAEQANSALYLSIKRVILKDRAKVETLESLAHACSC